MLRRQCLKSSLVAASALLSGCSPLRALNALVPRTGYMLAEGISYGETQRQRLDVYLPAVPDASRAVVVFFYGGNWNSGDRADYRFVGEALSSRGFVTVLPDYRLYPDVRFPDFLDDCAHAVRWAFAHAAEFGGDAQQLFVAGHSAGAYNAAMLALNAEYLERDGPAPRLRGWIGLAGPYDFLPLQSPVTKG